MPAKKTTAKKVAKKTPAKRTPSKKAKAPKYETFKVTRSDAPFLKPKVTMQTIYWSIIAIAVLVIGLWTIVLQVNISNLYTELEATKSATATYTIPPQQKANY